MPRDMDTIRIDRLHKIMALLETSPGVTYDELLDRGEYSGSRKHNRNLQNDLRTLREGGAEIRYDRRKNIYILERSGSFTVKLNITRQEAEALTSGLKMAGHFLPHLKDAAKSLWRKLDTYIPHDISRESESLSRMTTIALPVAKVNAEIFDSLLDAMRTSTTYTGTAQT